MDADTDTDTGMKEFKPSIVSSHADADADADDDFCRLCSLLEYAFVGVVVVGLRVRWVEV